MHRLAEADMSAIASFISRDSPANAVAFLDRIDACMDKLVEYPNRFAAAPEAEALGRKIRQVVVAPAQLLFSVDAGTVTVRRMRHTARDTMIAEDFPPAP
jgi:plasmid stabilization system protein ParE